MRRAAIALLFVVVPLVVAAQYNVLDTPSGVPHGLSLPSACSIGGVYFKDDESPGANLYGCTAPNTWTALGGGSSGGVPAGAVVFVDSGTCPGGFAEVAGLAGRMILATIAAAGDVGTTGGSDSVTPSGSVSAPTFAGSAGTVPAQTIAWPASVPTHSGTAASFSGSAWTPPAISWPAGVPTFSGTPITQVINHTHGVTVTWNVQGGTTAATTGTHVMTSTATGGSARAPTTGDVVSATTANPSGGVASITPAGSVAWPAGVPTVASYTPAGSVSITNQGTISWPAAVPSNSTVSFTPAGTVGAPTFTGNSLDNRSAFVRLIGCKKT